MGYRCFVCEHSFVNLEGATFQEVKREALRIVSEKNVRRMMVRKWDRVIEMREAGSPWEEIAAVFDRHVTTVQRFFVRGIKQKYGWYTPTRRVKLGQETPKCIHCKFYSSSLRDFRRRYPTCTLGSFNTEPTAGCARFEHK